MAVSRAPHTQTFDELYASGVPKRDPTTRGTRLTVTEKRIVYWLYWRGDHPAAIARQTGIGKSTVLDRIRELHECPSIIRPMRLYLVTEPREVKGRRKSWAFFCRLCGYRGEGPRLAGLQHVADHFFGHVRAADLNGNQIIEYKTHRRLERSEREGWRDYWEQVGKRRGFFKRLLGS